METNMQLNAFLVGGAVRDQLLRLHAKDRDYVVVGETVQSMLDRGFSQVGKDFPVFLHPDTREEYALARTERSTGDGHTDFVVQTDNVTLKDDLARRDLTINAIALAEGDNEHHSDEYVDPFNGRRDLTDRILRHVTDAGFVEDPLRVVRLARFTAKFPSFTVAPETTKLVRKMVADGMLLHLTAERVANEMTKALLSERPARFFTYLHMVGALEQLFPELYALTLVPAGPYLHHPEGDAFTHTMLVLDQLTGMDDVTRFCALVHDLGKGNTPTDILPHHYGHEARGVPLVDAMADRLKLSSMYRQYGRLVAEFHTHVHNVAKLNPKTIVALADSLDVRRHRRIAFVLSDVSRADANGRGLFYDSVDYPNALQMYNLLQVASSINARDVFTEAELAVASVGQIKERLYRARVAAVSAAKKTIFGE